jgi:hypothetical protein
MFSDHILTFAGRSVTITSHDLLMVVFSLVSGLLFWALVYFSRKRIVVVKRSSGTDQLTYELSRIADALERIANRPADRIIAKAMRGQRDVRPAPLQRESTGVLHSMFGR